MPVLTGIDVLGVQRYVFASNRLRDAVAASWLVHWAASRSGALGVANGDVLLASGGNAILQFGKRAEAEKFAARYSRCLYEEAPELEVAIAHREFETGHLAEALEQLQVELACAKLERRPSVPLLGISVTAPCRITGLPAAAFDPQEANVPLSRVVLRWRDGGVRESAAERWEQFLEGDGRFAFPDKIDDMGRTRGDTSLLGVVHVDGNGIGKRIANWRKECRDALTSDAGVTSSMQEWAQAIDGVGAGALQSIVTRVRRAVSVDAEEPRLNGAVADLGLDLKEENGRILLPLRPVLLGGDDVTFICDGRIALDLAETTLESFIKEIPHLGEITACAGVAVVPAHAPFDRAYELAVALCENAKARRREERDEGAWIDWHIGVPRPGEAVRTLRERSYLARVGGNALSLTTRPNRLGANEHEPETWRWLSRTVLGTGGDGFRGDDWRQHRNKLKELATAVWDGPDGVKRAREAATVAATLRLPGGLDQNGGFIANRTPLLDAVELLDVYLPLERQAQEVPT